jgi:hypothetical protein
LPLERPVQKEKAQQPMLLLSLSANTYSSSSGKKETPLGSARAASECFPP